MIKDYQNVIDNAYNKFNNSISQIDIIAWLENFDTSDWTKALIVLNNFEYFSTNDIIKEFDDGLINILERIRQDEKLFLIPVGAVGKSGVTMIYYLKKTPSFSNRNVIIVSDESYDHEDKKIIKFSQIPDECTIVLVDDFSGSGETILDFYKAIRKLLPKNHITFALTVAFLDKAKENLGGNYIKIFGNQRLPSFSQRGSIFGYYPKMAAIRNFCFEYGDKLYPEVSYKAGKTRQHPLGFSNTQALIGFEHSIPNNTLPIIWADINIKGTNKKWNPLFPRRGKLLMQRAEEFKRTQRYWASIVYKLGLEQVFSQDKKYSKKSVQLISLIHLKRKHKSALNICQLLGLNLREYELLMSEGMGKNLFDINEELTEQGKNIFEQIMKKVKFNNNALRNPELEIEEDMLYIPKIFRGGS
jgi:orotate phosphoribosyltransferase